MKYIRLRKISPTNGPDCAPGDPVAYPYGSISAAGQSLPVEYVLEGWLVREPAVGERVEVLRCVRNGVDCPGYFTSTVVTAVYEGEFHTRNSVYLLVQIPFASEADRARAEQHPYFSRMN